ncbi:MAG: amidohydrolase family protein [Myxococcales bacterium]|nr:amidohydrolase family protein [Myxococcales bacterium]
MSARVLQGATIHAGDGQPPRIGDVVVVGGRMVAGPAPAGAEVRDCRGLHVSPGFVDAHVHLGLYPEGFPGEPKDLNEYTRPVTPELRATDGIWPGDVAFAKARAAGVTTVCVLPGSGNVVGGTGVVLKTAGQDVERMALRDPACLKVAFGHNVKHSHGILHKRAPLTRMGIAALFRETFDAALAYEQKRVIDPACPEHRGHEVLVKALRRELPVRAHAGRSDDILTACRLAREYGLRLVIEHGYEADQVIEQLVAAKAAVVLGPHWRNCGNSEEVHFDYAATKRLLDAGLVVAHMTDHPIVPVGYLPMMAGLCVRAGLDADTALQVVTAHPARILGVEDRVGRVAPGLDADLVLLDGPPLAIASRVLETLIGGETVYRDGDPLPVPGQRH